MTYKVHINKRQDTGDGNEDKRVLEMTDMRSEYGVPENDQRRDDREK